MTSQVYSFAQIHIDAARNSTDDFNPFHDKHKWQRIHGNPFGAPIVLGFQLECLLEAQISDFRRRHAEADLIRDHDLRYSNYQLAFADVVRAGEDVTVEIKKSQFREGAGAMLSNRVLIRKQTGIVLVGHKRESRTPLYYTEPHGPVPEELSAVPDRSYLSTGGVFVKRKHMNTGNAKNFLSGSLVDQADYFDELEDRVRFPETFPTALISCALLERARKENLDFERAPMVYTAHEISVDRVKIAQMRSNDMLHLLVGPPTASARTKGLGKPDVNQQAFRCRGLNADGAWVFCANIYMAPLEEIRQ